MLTQQTKVPIMSIHVKEAVVDQTLTICRDDVRLEALLSVPEYAKGVVLFVHGAGSDRFSPRNQYVAESLLDSGFATLLVNLLTSQEHRYDTVTGKIRYNIPLLAGRVDLIADWIEQHPLLESLNLAYFGSGSGAAAAVLAAVQRPLSVHAVICRGGRLDLLPPQVLPDLQPPTLALIGQEDLLTRRQTQPALRRMKCEKKLVLVPGASQLFEEPGKLDEVARCSFLWLLEHLHSFC